MNCGPAVGGIDVAVGGKFTVVGAAGLAVAPDPAAGAGGAAAGGTNIRTVGGGRTAG